MSGYTDACYFVPGPRPSCSPSRISAIKDIRAMSGRRNQYKLIVTGLPAVICFRAVRIIGCIVKEDKEDKSHPAGPPSSPGSNHYGLGTAAYLATCTPVLFVRSMHCSNANLR
jgi:hypothetical protein